MESIPVFKPFLTEAEINAASESLRMGWLGPGSYVRDFEKALHECMGLDEHQHVVAVNTGTSAVHLALKIMGVGIGDEVITPSFNNIADFQSIKALGAEPVFCDIDETTLTIDPSTIESLISSKTKAIICLDYGAQLCDYNCVSEIAKKHQIPLLHDAAHAFGSAFQGKKVGSYSDLCVFSFDPVKNITCIDGGAIVTNNAEYAERMRYMRLLGQKQNQSILYQNQRSWTYDVDDIGYRYHLANLHAAVGIEQLKKLDEISSSRRKVYRLYRDALQNMSGIVLPPPITDDITPFIFIVRVLDGKRTQFREFLSAHGVDTGIHWQPGHLFSYFKDNRKGPLPVTDKIANEILTIPMYPEMTYAQMMHVVKTIQLTSTITNEIEVMPVCPEIAHAQIKSVDKTL